MIRALAGLLAMAAAPLGAATPPSACITTAEAEAMAAVAMPEILRQTGVVCQGRLSATSPIRQSNGALLSRYDAEADRAWPAARSGIVKLSVPQTELLLDSQFARPVIATLVAAQIVGRIAPSDCVLIDRLVTELQPLPARNTAGVVVTMLHYLKAEKAKGANVAVPDLPLCPVTAR